MSISSRLLLPCLLLVACTSTGVPSEARDVQELLAADRAFCADVQRDGLDAWVAWFHRNGVKVEVEGDVSQGHAAIRTASAPLFADPAVAVLWEPEVGASIVAGELGFTRGRFRLVRTDAESAAELARGTYFTVWRRTPEGWRVAFDTGVEDRPETEIEP